MKLANKLYTQLQYKSNIYLKVEIQKKTYAMYTEWSNIFRWMTFGLLNDLFQLHHAISVLNQMRSNLKQCISLHPL